MPSSFFAAPPRSPARSANASSVQRGARPERAVRRVYRVPCRLRLLSDGPGQRALVGQTVNLSADGVALQVTREVSVGQSVEVLVPRQRDEPLLLRGRVVHCRRVLAAMFEIGVAAG